MKDLLSTEQVAVLCGVDKRTIQKAVEKGKLAYTQKNERGGYLFKKEDAEIFAEPFHHKLSKDEGTIDNTFVTFDSSEITDNDTAISETLPELQIVPEFQDLIPPLTDYEFETLRDSCLNEGIREPIIVWGDVIIDGHNRYKIAKEYNLPFKTFTKNFKSKSEVIQWIVKNQLGRRNISVYGRCLLALKMKPFVEADSQQRMFAGVTPTQNSAQGATRDILAKLAETSHDTLRKVELLDQNATPEIKAQLLAGTISINAAYKKTKKLFEEKEREKLNIPKQCDAQSKATDTLSSNNEQDNIDNPSQEVADDSTTTDSISEPIDDMDAIGSETTSVTSSVEISNTDDKDTTENIINSDTADVTAPATITSNKLQPVPTESVDTNSINPAISDIINSAVRKVQQVAQGISNFSSSAKYYSTAEDLEKDWHGNIIICPSIELEDAFIEKLHNSTGVNHAIIIRPSGITSDGDLAFVPIWNDIPTELKDSTVILF